jgi:regulator of protease activity HflC (stomatin/prohibitin superfamily)
MSPSAFLILFGLAAIFFLMLLSGSIVMVKQSQVAIITRFGKYRNTFQSGLNFKTPFLDAVYTRISLQNRTTETKFQAITADQANVYFNAMLLYSVLDNTPESIQNVAFKFRSYEEFATALSKTIEGAVRAFVAGKKQSEVLTLRKEIVDHVKDQLDQTLKNWGYHIIDLQMNDITFDPAIMQSMAQVVASSNLRAAAENEGSALMIKRTKAAEADGNAIKISADAEREAAKLRGQGVAQFREEAAKGLSRAKEMLGDNDDATYIILFSMWTDTMKAVAENGKGNIIFFDGSTDGMQDTIKRIMGMMASNSMSATGIGNTEKS